MQSAANYLETLKLADSKHLTPIDSFDDNCPTSGDKNERLFNF